MRTRKLDKSDLAHDEDWCGNNVALTCPTCAKVFLVSSALHKNGRACPNCERATGHCTGGRKSDESEAWIDWDESS